MISIDFINSGRTPLYFEDYGNSFLSYLKETENNFNLFNVEYKMNTSKILMESSILDDDNDDYKILIETENKSFVQKIGAAIIELGKKFNEMIDKMIEKIKDITFRFKSNEKKMDILVKNHPELGKEKIKILCAEGGLDFSDINNLSKLDKAFDDILKMSKNANVDPDSLKGKWEAAKKKIFGEDYKAQGTIKLVTATVGLVVAVKTLGPQIVKLKNGCLNNKAEMNKRKADAYDNIVRSNPSARNDKCMKILLNCSRELHGYHAKAIGQQLSIIDKMENSIADGIDSLIGSKAGKKVLGDKTAALKTNLRNAQATYNRNAEDTAYHSQKGKIRADDENRNNNLRNAEDTAYYSQRGKYRAEDERNQTRNPNP